MGLPFNQQPAAPPAHLGWTERSEILIAAVRRIGDEFAAVIELRDRLLLNIEPVLRCREQINADPSAAVASDLDGFGRGIWEIMGRLWTLLPASMELDKEIISLKKEKGLAHGHKYLIHVIARLLEDAKGLIAMLKSLENWARDRVAAGSTDAPVDGDLNRERNTALNLDRLG